MSQNNGQQGEWPVEVPDLEAVLQTALELANAAIDALVDKHPELAERAEWLWPETEANLEIVDDEGVTS